MIKTQEMLNAINAKIKSLSTMGYEVKGIEGFTTRDAEVVFSHPAMGDGWNYHVTFRRNSFGFIHDDSHESHVEGWDEGDEVRRVRKMTQC